MSRLSVFNYNYSGDICIWFTLWDYVTECEKLPKIVIRKRKREIRWKENDGSKYEILWFLPSMKYHIRNIHIILSKNKVHTHQVWQHDFILSSSLQCLPLIRLLRKGLRSEFTSKWAISNVRRRYFEYGETCKCFFTERKLEKFYHYCLSCLLLLLILLSLCFFSLSLSTAEIKNLFW